MTEVWEKVGGDFAPTFQFKKPGQSIEGVLISKRERPKDKLKYSDSSPWVYTVEGKDGPRSIFGAGLLDHIMRDVSEGEQLRIVYGGKEKYTKEGKKLTSHRYEVYRPKVSGKSKARAAR